MFDLGQNPVFLNWVLFLPFAAFAALAGLEALVPVRQRAESSDSRLLANFGLGLLAMAASALVPFGVLEAAVLANTMRIGLFQQFPVPFAAQLTAAILAHSLATYWQHRALHAFPLLWRVHAVHHSDRAIDVSTGFRNHPLELALSLPVMLAVVVGLGLTPELAMIMVMAGLVAAFWQHAAIRLPGWLERALRPVLITPALHRLHHAEARSVHDSNYGDFLTVWDRLFGTYCDAASDPVRPGLTDDTPQSLALPGLLMRPFRPAPRPAAP